MKTIHVFWKDFLILSKDRGTYISLFVLPIMFSVVLTLALGGVFGGGKSSSPIVIPIAASTSDAQALAKTIEKIPGIKWNRTTLGSAKSAVGNSRSLGAVLIADNGKRVDFYEDPTQLTNANLLFGQIKAYLMAATVSADSVAVRKAAAQDGSIELQAHLDAIKGSGSIAFTSTQASQNGKAVQPTAAEQYIPGFTVAFLFFIATTIAQYMFMERERGTLRRLLTSPVRRYSILIGKLLPNVLIGFGQVVVIFGVGRLLFGLHLGDPLALFLVTCAAVAAANGFGLMITALSKTQAQATGLSTLLVFTLATVAGCYVPLSFMPAFMQTIALATPQGWAMSAFQNIMIKGTGVTEVLPGIGVLIAFALVFFLIGLSRFRFTN
ncbi:ABC transporter permease [Diaminobutyricibacter sp. McL0618]|uniref:ABC transporter permease n=1 Tax=Leifsonia sp. McL0618 TaxID=3415677 RepID=UPI003CEEBF77